jgi:hypothetical protein
MESICSIGSGSGGAGLPHCLILTIITISKSATMKPISKILSFNHAANLTILIGVFLMYTIFTHSK